MITVFVTGAGGGVGQGVVKSLKMIQDLEIRIITADMSALAPALYVGDKAYLVPPASDPQYVSHLIALFEREGVDYYIPGTDIELRVCASNAHAIESRCGTKVVVSPLEAIEVADDKYLTCQFLKEAGLAAPASFLPEQTDLAQIQFPVIVKPRIGYRSIGVAIARNARELAEACERNPALMIQELIATEEDEYTCTVVVMQGKASDVVVLKRVLRAGDTYRATPIHNPIISEYVQHAALALGVEGPCNVQLRLDAGQPKIFEINCRFSGTTPFCAQLGFNPVEFYLKGDRRIPYHYALRYDVSILRYWAEMMVCSKEVAILNQVRTGKPGNIFNSTL